MTAAEKARLETELAGELRSWKVITRLVWADAICVMLVGLGVVNTLLKANNFPPEIAWLVAPTVDIGLVVGLFGSQDLARHGIKAGWVGALRWVCAALTWALNTAPSWLAPGGPKVPGILLHSVAPVLLFFVTEAAAYFMSKKGRIIADLRQRIDAAERDDRADRAQRAELQERVRRADTERINAVSEARRLADEVATLTASQERSAAAAEREINALRSEVESVRSTLSGSAAAALESVQRQHAQTLSELAEKHAAELARVRAEAETVSLDRYRRDHPKSARKQAEQPTKREKISDDEAARRCLDYEQTAAFRESPTWTYRRVADVAGISQNRVKDVLALIEKHHAGGAPEASQSGAGRASEAATDEDAKEGSRVLERVG